MPDANAAVLVLGKALVDNNQPGLPWANYTFSFIPSLKLIN